MTPCLNPGFAENLKSDVEQPVVKITLRKVERDWFQSFAHGQPTPREGFDENGGEL